MRNRMGPAFLCLALSICTAAGLWAQKVPGWVDTIPPADANFTYFVSDASDPGGNVSTATDMALSKMISSIIKYMGVKVKSEFEADTQATLDTFSASMKQKVSESSEARITGFTVSEKFTSKSKKKKDKSVTVYVLGKYDTKELEKERDRIRKLIEEQENVVLVPESNGNQALQAGRVSEAVQYFLQAASGAASLTGLDNRDIKIQRNLNNARNAIMPLRIVKVSGPSSLGLGQAPSEPFVVKVVKGEDEKSPGLAGVALEVSYQRKQASGRLISKTENLSSDASGLVSFSPPAFEFVGNSKISFKLSMQSGNSQLDAIPESFASAKDSFIQDMSTKYLELSFSIGSEAKELSFAVCLVDVDEAGKQGSLAQGSALEQLQKQKYKVKGNSSLRAAVAAGDESAVIAASAGLDSQRLIFGVATISGVRKDSGSFVASCKINLKVLDVQGKEILVQSDKSQNGVGSSEEAARQAAFKAAAASAIKDLLSKM